VSGAVYPSVDSVARFLRFFKVGDRGNKPRWQFGLIAFIQRNKEENQGTRPATDGDGSIERRLWIVPKDTRDQPVASATDPNTIIAISRSQATIATV
jgi:hypothetical protein